jgi:hypothetical protein
MYRLPLGQIEIENVERTFYLGDLQNEIKAKRHEILPAY